MDGKFDKVDFARLTNLEQLYLPDSRLSRSIPTSLGQATALQHLVLYGNELSNTIPPSVASLPNLVNLDLTGNALTGPVPSFDNEGPLEVLKLSYNGLTGPLHTLMDSLPADSLTDVSVNDNFLTGSIPTEIGLFTTLTNFAIQSNQILTGTVPSQMGLATMLREIRIDDNHNIEGTLPHQLSMLNRLTILDVSGNQMTGTISPLFASLSQLAVFRIHSNNFTGNLDDIFCSGDVSSAVTDLTADCFVPSDGEIQYQTYAGCFRDQSGSEREFPFQFSSVFGDVTSCRQGCGSFGYNLAGLQNGSECFCGDSFGCQSKTITGH